MFINKYPLEVASMTNASFCDLHPDQATSLIRGDKSAVTTLVVQTTVKEVAQDGKKVSWTRETKLNACPKCTQDLILSRAQALGVNLEWDEYRLTQKDGKYTRVNRTPEEQEESAKVSPMTK